MPRELREFGEMFDKVIFLNDLVFTIQDVQNSTRTRNGDYTAACSMNLSNSPCFYHTLVLRDSKGHDALLQTWPFFRARGSRKALTMSFLLAAAVTGSVRASSRHALRLIHKS